jgi:hypothetical protein
MKELNTFRKFLAEEQINEDYFNEAKFTEYNNNELAAYVKNNPKDKEAEKELHKRAQGIKALSRTDEGFLDLNEDEGKTISLYPFYNEKLAQKLFAMGIKDGYDWDDFLGKKLGVYWEGDPEGDGTMMYNVQEPLYSEIKDRIKVLLKRIMTDTLEEGQLNELNETRTNI